LNVQRSHATGYFLGGRPSIHSDFIDSPITAVNLIFVED
jgi:DNA polymerase III alpha subunit (gram-positive type)